MREQPNFSAHHAADQIQGRGRFGIRAILFGWRQTDYLSDLREQDLSPNELFGDRLRVGVEGVDAETSGCRQMEYVYFGEEYERAQVFQVFGLPYRENRD